MQKIAICCATIIYETQNIVSLFVKFYLTSYPRRGLVRACLGELPYILLCRATSDSPICYFLTDIMCYTRIAWRLP